MQNNILLHTNTKKAAARVLSPGGCLRKSYVRSIAAAAKNKNYSKNYNPCTVIIEKMAEAIVIHICSSKVSFELCSLVYYSTRDFLLQISLLRCFSVSEIHFRNLDNRQLPVTKSYNNISGLIVKQRLSTHRKL